MNIIYNLARTTRIFLDNIIIENFPMLDITFGKHIFPIIERISHVNVPHNPYNSYLNKALIDTKKFLISNDNIIFTKADKGNTTVALDRSDYVVRVNNMLSDTSTYIVLKRDPTRIVTRILNSILKRRRGKNCISHNVYRFLNHTVDGTLGSYPEHISCQSFTKLTIL